MRIVSIARASLHDGPGARSVVYFAGCSLACRWCHNPESIQAAPRLMFASAHCVRCGACAVACPAGCHQVEEKGHAIAFDRCVACGRCVDACPAGALSLSQREESVEAVARVVLADVPYYRATGGGVTLSGGECLLQAREAFELADTLRAEGVHVAAETALNVPEPIARAMSSHFDLALCDIKHIESARHRALTGAGNERVLKNLRAVSGTEMPYVVRTPVIPGLNDDRANLSGICDLLNSLPRPPLAYELLSYNNLGESKYEAQGLAYALAGTHPQTEAELRALRATVREKLRPEIAVGE